MTTPPRANFGLLGAMVAIVCWSAGNIMVREVPMPPLQIAFWRVLLGATVYTLLVYATGRRLTVAWLRTSGPAGIAIGLEIAIFFAAIKATTVANATVIAALQPLLLFAVARRRFGETVTRYLIAVSAVALTGVGLVMWGSSAAAIWSPRGDILAFVAVLFFAAYFAMAKVARETVPALEFQAAVWVVGSVVLLPVAVVDAGGLDVPDIGEWAWLAVLLLVPGTGHLLMNWAHARVRLTTTSMLTLALPVITSTGGVIFLDESIVAIQVGGIAIVLASLVLVVRRESELDDVVR